MPLTLVEYSYVCSIAMKVNLLYLSPRVRALRDEGKIAPWRSVMSMVDWDLSPGATCPLSHVLHEHLTTQDPRSDIL